MCPFYSSPMHCVLSIYSATVKLMISLVRTKVQWYLYNYTCLVYTSHVCMEPLSAALLCWFELWTRSLGVPHLSTHTASGRSPLPATLGNLRACPPPWVPPSPSTMPPPPSGGVTLHTGGWNVIRPLKKPALMFTRFWAGVELLALIWSLLLDSPEHSLFFTVTHHNRYPCFTSPGCTPSSSPTPTSIPAGSTSLSNRASCCQESRLTHRSGPSAASRGVEITGIWSHVTTSGWVLVSPQEEIASSFLWMRALVKLPTYIQWIDKWLPTGTQISY